MSVLCRLKCVEINSVRLKQGVADAEIYVHPKGVSDDNRIIQRTMQYTMNRLINAQRLHDVIASAASNTSGIALSNIRAVTSMRK